MSAEASVPTLIAESTYERRAPSVEALRRLARHRSARVGFFLLFIMVFTAIFAEWIAPFDPIKRILDPNVKRRDPPCLHLLGCPAEKPQHIFGIDGNSRDLFSRVVFGARVSLQVGLVTITFAIVVGGLLGAMAGYVGGWLDNLIMRSMDVLLAFPSLLLAIAIVNVLGPGLNNALLAIGFVSIPIFARLIRATILTVKELDYVSASRALGAGHTRLLFTRILPNALTPLIVRGTLGIATAILEVAALGFLGLGAQKPLPEWGSMLSEEKNSIFSAPHLVFFPGLAIMILVLSFNLIGDGMRDALDPRLRSEGT